MEPKRPITRRTLRVSMSLPLVSIPLSQLAIAALDQVQPISSISKTDLYCREMVDLYTYSISTASASVYIARAELSQSAASKKRDSNVA
ncbi:hypothetical protein I4U23_017772 [Adineta vaga]|nr:hypothetical protein I4U23_017772 [Adineta vaga]